jgi:hypothetical protein
MWSTVDDLIWTDNMLGTFSVSNGSTLLSDYVVKCKYSFMTGTGCEHVDVDDTIDTMLKMMRDSIGARISELLKAEQVLMGEIEK